MLHGVDVSHHQPGINWQEVAKSQSFSFIKATEGATGTDSLFALNWEKAQEAKLMRGAYHYFHPDLDASHQAEHFLSVLHNKSKPEMPPVIDWEVSGGMSHELQKMRALTFLEALHRELRVNPIIYSDVGFLEALGDLTAFKDYPLWIAHLGVPHPRLPPAWKTWTFWQHSFTGSVPGVPSQVDMNYFNGDMGQLMELS